MTTAMPRTARATATYLYCLLQAPRRPALPRDGRGLPGTGAPRLLDAGDGLWLVVGDAPLGQYGAERIERRLRDLEWVSACATGHEAVVEAAGRRATVVPMKLFTLFSSDDRAVEHVSRTRAALAQILARVEGRQEWGVRLTLDETALKARLERDRTRRPASGTGFLRQRQEAHQAARQLVQRARLEAERVFETLGRQADDGSRATPVTGGGPTRVLLDAAFLVERASAPRFRALVRRLAAPLHRQGLALTLTGPWPPYNFVGDGR